MSEANEKIATRFYDAFCLKDTKTMASLYHPEVHFEDPAFGGLNYLQVTAMWKMLFLASDDLSISFSIITSSADTVQVKWIAHYSFGKENRPVRNEIIANMKIQDNLIVRHIDNFDLRKWAKQAIGFSGWLLGGTHFFKHKLQKKTQLRLYKFIAEN